MAKSRDAFRTISEVSDWLETPAHVLRFWESRFTQIKPVKRAGGRRYYRPTDMALLGGIKRLLHEDGIPIKGVQKILREKGVKYVASLSHEAIGGEDQPKSSASPAGAEETPIEEILSEDQSVSAPSPERESVAEDPEPQVQPLRTEAHEDVPDTPAPTWATSPPEPSGDTADTKDSGSRETSPSATAEAPENVAQTVTDSDPRSAQTDRMTQLYYRLMALRDRLQMDMANG